MQDEDGRTETDRCRPHALDGCRSWHLVCFSLWPGTIDRIYSANTNSDFSYNSRIIYVYIYIYMSPNEFVCVFNS